MVNFSVEAVLRARRSGRIKSQPPPPNTKRGAGAEERRRLQPPEGASKPPRLGLPRRRTRARARRRAGREETRATDTQKTTASALPSGQLPPLPANDGRKRQQGGRSEPAATGAQPFAPRPRSQLPKAGASGRTGAKARRARERRPRAARTPKMWRGRRKPPQPQRAPQRGHRPPSARALCVAVGAAYTPPLHGCFAHGFQSGA